MKLKKSDYIAIFILIVVFVQLLVMYPGLPEQVPTNWGIDGSVSYSSKSTIWTIFAINVLLFPSFFVIPKVDPKGGSYKKIEGFYAVFRLVMVIFLSGVLEIVLFSTEDALRFPVGKIVTTAISLLTIFIGNYLPKCKQSYTLGIKNMWTLCDERVWNDTHRMGGRLFFIAGIISLIGALTLPENILSVVLAGSMLLTIGFTYIYSYLSYRKYYGHS